jgi:hypothetical protein
MKQTVHSKAPLIGFGLSGNKKLHLIKKEVQHKVPHLISGKQQHEGILSPLTEKVVTCT